MPRDRFRAFPHHAGLRWLVRFGFAVPFLLAAIINSPRVTDISTPNQQLIQHLATISWDRADIAWVGQIYPPLSTLVAAVIPGGRLGLGIAGAIVAGIFLQKMLEIMVQRRFTLTLTTLLMLALAGNPLFGYTATENLPAIMGLAFFGLGITDVVRFVAWGSTQSGFRAGIFLMLATLSDLSGLLYVLTAATAAPFLRLGRHGQRGARGANVLVIVFPTVAAMTSLIALNALFLGDPLGPLGETLLVGGGDRLASLAPLFSTVNGWLLIAPVLSSWLVALIVRRPGSILVSTLVFVAILGSYVLGLLPTGSAGNTFIVMTLMAIALIPTPRRRLLIAMVDIVALVQIVIAWFAAFNREIVVDWMAAIVNGGGLFG